jgi:hypothetical protein
LLLAACFFVAVDKRISEVKENGMKKLLVILMILSLATIANASAFISVDGVINPPDITLAQNGHSVISIWSDGGGGFTKPTMFDEFYMSIDGPGSFDLSGAVNYVNPGGIMDADWTEEVGDIFVDFQCVSLSGPPPLPYGTLADGIDVYCDGPGDVTLKFWGYSVYTDYQPVVWDTQVIHQIPEPMTLGLLGLGGLFLRRRK